ncbi:hypothetical protein J2T12_003545 [Paenibacillus anaericanus]|uniref:hypothetical protein n=1 Tax=Paenibacillus anaericanus TaxID=170367 RepID=UPI0027806447|nr:hypothetical protein [Paenibacillus anaericanus]MDQ0090131.1 hypothetical protein [Paenibacillus anaericanus]
MSEFSASYHLKTDNQQIVVDLIRGSNNEGYVFPEKNGWVTFVVKGEAFNIDESIISLNPSVLIHYIYAEDHGWDLRIFNKSEIAFEYGCNWTEEIQIEKSHFDLYFLNELIISQGNSTDGIESLFDIDEDIFDLDEPPAFLIAQKLGLTYYEWLSEDYIDLSDLAENILIVD